MTLDGPGEAFIGPPSRENDQLGIVRVAVRVPQALDVKARFLLPSADGSELWQLPFEISKDQWQESSAESFYRTMQQHYEYLASQRLPGTAWFRHRARLAAIELGNLGQDETDAGVPDRSPNRSGSDRTFDLMSGGRAIAENLRLDELIARSQDASDMRDVKNIRGITINPFDFTELLDEDPPQLDPLASMIPSDQHAFFFASFAGLLHTLDYANKDGIQLLQMAQLESSRSDLLEQYQTQLGLTLGQLARQLGPQFVKSLAVTGGDPYFDTGTDLAILFEPVNQSALNELLEAQVAFAAKKHKSAQAVEGRIAGVAYTGFVAPDRSISTYQSQLDGAIVVSNSLTQLARIIAASQRPESAVASAAEYRFFRQRYPIRDEDTSSLLVITDATIRRWCGPKWRIGASRRLYAASALADAQARLVDVQTEKVVATNQQWLTQLQAVAGKLSFSDAGVQSSRYGNLNFITPISELDVQKASAAEVAGYERWRDRYEGRWRRKFDPIAIHFDAHPKRWSADVTVVPLTASTDYGMALALTQGAKIAPQAADVHAESLVHMSAALNKDAGLVRTLATALSPQLPEGMRIDPLAWFGSTVSFYADDSDFWDELDSERFDPSLRQAPIALSLEVVDGTRLLPFLIGLRSFINQVMPGATVWDTLQYGEYQYTRISTTERLRSQVAAGAESEFLLYYAITGPTLVFSPNEKMIHRALDRLAQGESYQGDPSQVESAEQSVSDRLSEDRWLGENLTVQLDGEFIKALQRVTHVGYRSQLRSASWSNLPILNEWKRKYPDQDPVIQHQQLWGRELICVGGGQYRWNAELQSMESTSFGSPGSQDETQSLVPIPFRGVSHAAFGVTFEHGGLRARMHMERSARPTAN